MWERAVEVLWPEGYAIGISCTLSHYGKPIVPLVLTSPNKGEWLLHLWPAKVAEFLLSPVCLDPGPTS